MASLAFDDRRTHDHLSRALVAADLLLLVHPGYAELAGNPMGDTNLLHALTFSPL